MSELRPAAAESGAAEYRDEFVRRHVGTSDDEQSAMLKVLGYETLDALIDAAVPNAVRSLGELRLPPRPPSARCWTSCAGSHRATWSPSR